MNTVICELVYFVPVVSFVKKLNRGGGGYKAKQSSIENTTHHSVRTITKRSQVTRNSHNQKIYLSKNGPPSFLQAKKRDRLRVTYILFYGTGNPVPYGCFLATGSWQLLKFISNSYWHITNFVL